MKTETTGSLDNAFTSWDDNWPQSALVEVQVSERETPRLATWFIINHGGHVQPIIAYLEDNAVKGTWDTLSQVRGKYKFRLSTKVYEISNKDINIVV